MAPTFEQVFPVLYKGWGEAGARADFNAGGWKNKAGAEQFTGQLQNPEDRIDNAIANTFQQLQAEANKRFKEYNDTNPFVYDDVLKEKTLQAKEQIGVDTQGTYYNEKLSDYLLGVDRKIQRGGQDLQDVLGELQATTKSYGEQTQLKLNESINNARQGYADVGLFDSGARLRNEGLQQTTSDMATEDFNRQQQFKTNQAQQGYDRGLEDTLLGKKQDVRDIYRASGTDVTNLAGQLTKEQGQKYTAGFNATLPPELQSNQNYDILKQIGIYG